MQLSTWRALLRTIHFGQCKQQQLARSPGHMTRNKPNPQIKRLLLRHTKKIIEARCCHMVSFLTVNRPLLEQCLLVWVIEAEWHIYLLVTYVIIGSDNGLLPDRHQSHYMTLEKAWRGHPHLSVLSGDPLTPAPIREYTDRLTHWGWVTHICVRKLSILGSDNGLSPGRRQAIIWTNAGIKLIGPLGTNFSEILIGIQTFTFKKMHLKMSSGKSRPFVSASMC